MTAVPQHRGVVSVDNSAGSLTDISSGVTSWTWPGISQNVAGHFTIGSDFEQATVGGAMGGEIKITVRVEKETSTAYDLLATIDYSGTYATRAQDFTVRVDTPDSTSGSQRYQAECKFVSLVPSDNKGGAGDIQTAVATYHVNGAVTRSTIA